jgi:hypothetical protein
MIVGDSFTLFDTCRPHPDATFQPPLDPTSPFLVSFDIAYIMCLYVFEIVLVLFIWFLCDLPVVCHWCRCALMAARNSAIFPCCVTISLYYEFYGVIRCIWTVLFRIHGCWCWFRLLSTWRPHLGDATEVPLGPPSWSTVSFYLALLICLYEFDSVLTLNCSFLLIYSFISLLSQGHYHHVDNSVHMVVLTIYITI